MKVKNVIRKIKTHPKVKKVKRHIHMWYVDTFTARYVSKVYYERMHRKLNLKNPETLTDKMLWLMVYDKNPLYTKCADKVAVREYVVDKFKGTDVAPPLFSKWYGVWDSPDEIDFDKLPDSFVLKANHLSGAIIIVTDKTKLDIESAKGAMRGWLKSNYYTKFGEWQYRNIKPKIICEELLEEDIVDYKLFCYNGKVNYMFFKHHNSNDGKNYIRYFDIDWNEYDWRHHMDENWPLGKFEKPKNFDTMVKMAEILSQDFVLARIDFYDIDGVIYFGEITFTHGGGMVDGWTYDIDKQLGKNLKLPLEK